MTVVATKDSRKVVSNTGFVNPIAFDQYIESSTHIKVYADTTLLSVGTHYTISGVGDLAGIEVTITATGIALAPDDWVVLHDPLIDQDSDLSVGGTFGAAYENAADKIIRRLQAVNDKVERSFRASINTVDPLPELDLDGIVEGETLELGPDGAFIPVPGLSTSVAASAASAAAAAASALAAQTSETAALASAAASEAWAITAEDTPVPDGGGLFSALHYATKAAALVAAITLPAAPAAGDVLVRNALNTAYEAQDAATFRDTIGVKGLNADGGFTLPSATHSQSFNVGPFGGAFLNARAADTMEILRSDGDVTAAPRFTLAVTSEIDGGHPNGPGNQRSPVWFMSRKTNHLTTLLTGEIDVGYIVMRQGRKDDAGGFLIDVAKVFGTAEDTGGLTPIEISAKKISSADVATRHVQCIPGFMEGVGGATNGNGSAWYAEARVGAIDSFMHVIGRSDLSGAPAFSNIIIAATSRNVATDRYFRIDGLGHIYLGNPANQMRLIYNTGTSALNFQNTALTTNVASLTQAGVFSALGGLQVNGVTAVDASNGLRLPSYTGAQLADAAHAVNTTNKVAGKLVYQTVSNRILVAAGSATTANWCLSDGTVAVTPV